MIRAEIISIGDELSSGQRLDTNSQWLSQQLGELGVRVLFHTTVGDDLDANVQVFRIASQRVDLVVCTGGLGPTADDLTRQAMADAFELPLVMDSDSMRHIEQLFSMRKRPMPEQNRIQAYFPQGTIVIPNPHGSAPGIDLTVIGRDGHCRLFALPGVPAEMKQMYDATVKARLRSELGLGTVQLYYKTIKLFGIGESDVEAKLPNLIARDRYPKVGITVSRATITLRIATEAESENHSESLMENTVHEIEQTFGDLIFGMGEVELEDVIIQLLRDRKETVSVIEVGADSLISKSFSRADSFENRCYVGGIQLRDLHQGERLIRTMAHSVRGTEEQFEMSPKSAPLTEEMLLQQLAKEGNSFFGSDWCLVVGTYPEYEQVMSSRSIPVSSLTIALSYRDQLFPLRHFELGAHPDVLYHRLAKTGLDQFRRALLARTVEGVSPQ